MYPGRNLSEYASLSLYMECDNPELSLLARRPIIFLMSLLWQLIREVGNSRIGYTLYYDATPIHERRGWFSRNTRALV